MRRSWLLAGVLAGGLVLAACGGGGSGSGGSGGGGEVRVAAVIKGLDNPFFAAMQKGITASAKQHGVDATIQAANDITDTTGQADKLNALAQQDFDCYIVNPISGSNLVSPLARVAAKHKPIVN
ncbi:MAG: substrate-binding domain-containing protein, partial [Nocardioidaceae bacterium]